ncbi:MAG: hypothetical protein VR69_04350 [Peptococcaceae bacterium BRH_c4b]|nr:MAG: hypothetical protein VR69_04350 [Peptococcaceae bacterium BRH_c4b]
MKKFVTISLLIFLFLISGNIALAAENDHSGHSGPSTDIQSGEHSSHDATLQQSNDVIQPSHSEHQSNEPSQSSTGHGQSQGTSSPEHSSHDGQAQNQNSEAHDGGHGVKEVKEVNIKPWVYAFLAYTAGVLLLALILKKGRGKNNELVS